MKKTKKKMKKVGTAKTVKTKIPEKKSLIVIALGGNALIRKGQKGTEEEQLKNLESGCEQIAKLIKQGYRIVITHGNGPQVGNILIQNEMAKDQVPALPLDACGAQSQGEIGYFIQQKLMEAIKKQGLDIEVATIITRVAVNETDPAFNNPTKPIGPFYTKERAQEIAANTGYKVIEDAGRGYRRVVPSPDPKRILEVNAIRALEERGMIVIACGGGGIPVFSNNHVKGAEAVIDKDLAAELLASTLNADILIMLTDVENAFLNYGTENQRALKTVKAAEARTYLAENQFASGSMGPKIEAAIRFSRAGRGRKAIIARLDSLEDAIEGKCGTIVTHD
jgi:carbamate kinase